MYLFLAPILITVAITSVTKWLYRWSNPRCNGKLPPGSMGWPLLGETLHFFTPSTTFDVFPFVKIRMQRYGSIFRTSIVGKPFILLADVELNNYVFEQEGKSFQSWYPSSFVNILGRQNISSVHGSLHKYLRNMVRSLFDPESLKGMLPDIESVVLKQLNHCTNLDTVEILDATETMIFSLIAKKLISYDTDNSSENLKENFVAFIRGFVSFPLNLPGTTYYECLQGRKRAMKMLKNILQERRMKPRKQSIDFFDHVLDELSKEATILTEEIVLDLIFTLLFASFETPSLALTLAVKFLTDYPLVLQKLTVMMVLRCIRNRRQNSDSGLTWTEYKSMKFTFQFIKETLRLANLGPVIFRKALQDVEFKGYTIPAGWGVIICPPPVHLNPTTYENPLEFDPWRWEGEEINGASKHFMAFGRGLRYCAGAHFAKAQMAVFLHYLVTNYRWHAIKGRNILRVPGLQFPDGFHVRLVERRSNNGLKSGA